MNVAGPGGDRTRDLRANEADEDGIGQSLGQIWLGVRNPK